MRIRGRHRARCLGRRAAQAAPKTPWEAEIAENPLFYKATVPLNRDQHRDLKLTSPERPFAHVAGSHVVPALAEEFVAAARHIPIVFLMGTRVPTAVFLVGLHPGKNHFVDDKGAWTGTYIPAYVRRYPFIIGETGGSDPVICIDQSFEGFKSGQEGVALFEEDGKESALLVDKIRFSNDYFQAAKRTEVLAEKLREYDLLRSISVEVKGNGSESAAVVHGIFAVDDAKLAALPDDQFLSLRREGLLAPLYAHLLSLGAVDRLAAAQTGEK